ncbi:MAG: transglycosylase domain-containing protein [Desulforhopalus sp.]|nr:transglycosylase domain-containing protein [Desulforhopalus sp.]
MARRRCFTSKRPLLWCCLGCCLVAAALWLGKKTWEELRPFQTSLLPDALGFRRYQFLDRNGVPLSATFDNPLNVHDWLPLHEIPALLQDAFIASEDRRFYRHHGVDWLARGHALLQNLKAWRGVRGASTITEQVVRILHPRPRTLWSRWLEGIEAAQLEGRFSKAEIFEFYLNQVPYSRQRRGVLQAARLYFDRDPATLTTGETLALAVLVRAPSRLGESPGGPGLDKPLARLAAFLQGTGQLAETSAGSLRLHPLALANLRLPAPADHFLRHLASNELAGSDGRTGPARIVTTLDGNLQTRLHDILRRHLADLKRQDVHNGAVLAVNHQTDEILAWLSVSATAADAPDGWLDAVTSPRQPGSTLKPFLYALALDRGWSPATIIEDAPLARPVGDGMHPFRNYSRRHYGPLRLREALGNSLNIPAVRTVQFTGVDAFLDRLHALGMASLDRSAGHYGEGLALGNGEVTLLELVRGYAALARGGVFHPLRATMDGRSAGPSRHRVYSREAAALIADILSDPEARRLEFGNGGLLRFPVQTAAKTGTSNDHRDAWAVGFNHRHTVGIWMGNLDGHPTGGLTGSTGPAVILRTIFAELGRFEEPEPLPTSPLLAEAKVCSHSGLLAGPSCPAISEKFMPGTLPRSLCDLHSTAANRAIAAGTAPPQHSPPVHILQPSPNLQMAMDPHIPDAIEAYPMKISENYSAKRVEWIIDGQLAGISGEHPKAFMWPLSQGSHLAQARVWQDRDEAPVVTPEVRFVVK